MGRCESGLTEIIPLISISAIWGQYPMFSHLGSLSSPGVATVAERWRIDAFELWCWRRLLRVPWTSRRSNRSILKEISPGYSLEGLMLKLKLQYFGHLLQRVDSLQKTDAGRDWGQEEKGTTEDEMAGWHHRLDRHESEWTPGVGDGQGGLACCDSWGRKELVTTKWLNWTDGCICICVYSVTLFIVVINLCLYIGLLQFCGVFLFSFSLFIILIF